MRMTKSVLFGTCQLCSERKSKAAMVGHLKRCLPASTDSDGSFSQVLLLRVQAGARMFWLDLMTRPEGKLRDIDRLLRRIWLECCGHLSEFYAGAHHKIGMSTKVGDVFASIGNRLDYIYDFGSSTELVVSFSGFAKANSGVPFNWWHETSLQLGPAMCVGRQQLACVSNAMKAVFAVLSMLTVIIAAKKCSYRLTIPHAWGFAATPARHNHWLRRMLRSAPLTHSVKPQGEWEKDDRPRFARRKRFGAEPPVL